MKLDLAYVSMFMFYLGYWTFFTSLGVTLRRLMDACIIWEEQRGV